MSPLSFKVTCHLIFRAERTLGGRIKQVKPVAMRIGHPALRQDEAAIKVALEIPEALFDAASVAIVVEPPLAMLAISQEPVDAEVSGAD